jgi:X-Pro dipeptidyl-peptidase
VRPVAYSPYDTLGGTPATNLASGSPWVANGYARAIADVIGTRNSTGCWDYGGTEEQRSGVDVVEAFAKRPLSNGKVA